MVGALLTLPTRRSFVTMASVRPGILVLVLVCGLLSACQGRSTTCGPDFGTGTSTHDITVDGQKRSYTVHVPKDIGTDPVPVLYLFHGLGDQSETVIKQTRTDAMSDDRNVLLVAPQAAGEKKAWDVYGIATDQGKDATFVDELKRRISGLGCVDKDRQYVAGMSNGSGVSFALACRGGYAGYAGVALTFTMKECDDAPPASILYAHGTADKYVPFQGGQTPIFPVAPATTVIRKWADHDRCGRTPAGKEVGGDTTLYAWDDCADGVRLHYYVVRGGGHTWPGSNPMPPLGKTTTSFSATRVIADFFKL